MSGPPGSPSSAARPSPAADPPRGAASPGGGYRWVVLGVGVTAQASTAAYFQGLASIAPALRAAE